MTNAAAPSAPARSRQRTTFTGWLAAKDPDLLVVKRSVRAAVVMPSVFALCHQVFSNPQVGLFGAFGSFALLLFVEFTGPTRARLVSYGSLYLAGCCFIALGTVVSSYEVAAVVVTAFVVFGVLFVGVAAPQAATASTAALLLFVLPVSVVQPASAVGPRLLGWTIAAAVSISACILVWPAPWHDNLRRRLALAVDAVARLARARADGRSDPAAQAAVDEELARLRNQFSGTPYPPTGAAAGAVALSKLVGRVEWVAGNTAITGDDHWANEPRADVGGDGEGGGDPPRGSRAHLRRPRPPRDDPARIEAVQESARQLDELIDTALEADVSSVTDGGAPAEAAGDHCRRSEPGRIAGPRVSMPAPLGLRPRWWQTARSRRRERRRSSTGGSAWRTSRRRTSSRSAWCRTFHSVRFCSATRCAARSGWLSPSP